MNIFCIKNFICLIVKIKYFSNKYDKKYRMLSNFKCLMDNI